MRAFPGILVLIAALPMARLARSESFPIGVGADYPVEEFEDPAQVWLPSNYDPSRNWPVIFYYHGTDRKPTIEYLRLFTEGKDWVLVGLGYRQRGRFHYTKENLDREIEILRRVRADLSGKIRIDPAKVYVSGFSKGGWMTGLFLQTVPGLAGGMILGGGWIDAEGGRIPPGLEVYVGAGELDGNIAMSFGAGEILKKNGAVVVSDIWEGWGHRMPVGGGAPGMEKMKQWLRMQAGVASKGEAIEWFESEWSVLDGLGKEDKVRAFHHLIRISGMPYCRLLDSEAESVLRERQEHYRTDDDLRDEWAAWVGFRKALEMESRDRQVSTLAEALARYVDVGRRYPDTSFGRKALESGNRIRAALGIEF